MVNSLVTCKFDLVSDTVMLCHNIIGGVTFNSVSTVIQLCRKGCPSFTKAEGIKRVIFFA